MSDNQSTTAMGELDALVATGHWDELMDVMGRDWAGLLASDAERLLGVLDAMPAEVLRDNPRWDLARTYISRITGGDAAAATRFRHTPLAGRPVALMDALAELTSRSAALRANGRFTEAAARAREARHLLDDASEEALREAQPGLPDLHLQWAMVSELAGDLTAAIREYTDAFDHAVISRHPFVQLNAAGSLAWIHTLAGRNAEAATWLSRLPPTMDDSWWSTRYSVPAQLAQAYILIDELRYEDARELLRTRIDVTQYPEFWAGKAMLQSMVLRNEREATDLLVTLDARTTGLPVELKTKGTSGGLHSLARSALLARAGYLSDAIAALHDESIDTRELIGQLMLSARCSLELLTGHASSAERGIALLRSQATGSPRVMTAATALSAVAALRRGDPAGAGAAFHTASSIARAHGVYSSFIIFSHRDLTELFANDPNSTELPPVLRERILAKGRSQHAGDAFARLSAREAAVVEAVLTGGTIADAARTLFVSPNTVKSQLRSIYEKLEIHSRSELQALADAFGRGLPTTR